MPRTSPARAAPPPGDIPSLSLRTLTAAVQRGELTAAAVVQAYAARIHAQEPQVQAWSHFTLAGPLAAAQALDRTRRPDRHLPVPLPLAGVPVGVKDLIDTADLPTAYGSPIYQGHQPARDAACVALCRALGGVVMGKTVTTEFATFQPGPTCNPRSPAGTAHTPGGSSSGSAAAVACGMVPIAFGTQTAGSIIRPAAFCGVVGYKPTHGLLPLAGIKPLAPSLDTLGVLARSVDDAAFFVGALAQIEWRTAPASAASPACRVGVCLTGQAGGATRDTLQAMAQAAAAFDTLGAAVQTVTLPVDWAALGAAQVDIMGAEAWAAFAPERANAAATPLFSPAFRQFLVTGAAVSGTRLLAAQRLAGQARAGLTALFATVDVLLVPSAPGEAPTGLAATGDPVCNRAWTLLGLPCVHVPTGVGATGMPVGVTLVGPPWGDGQVLDAADRLQRSVQQPP